MNWQVSLRAAAKVDLRESRESYEQKRSGLSDEFTIAVEKAFALLERSPDLLPPYYLGLRRVFVERFPYKIFDRIHNESVVVFRVLHVLQDHTWRLR